MKNKLLSILLAFCMMVLLVPTAAMADESAVVQVGSAETRVGEPVRIPVTITTNPGIVGAMLDISYPENLLTLTAIEKGHVFSGGMFTGSPNEKNVQWFDVSNNANITTTGIMFTLEFNAIGSGSAEVTVNYADGEPKNFGNIDSDSVPVTFTPGTVTIISDVVTYTVTFDYNGGTESPTTAATGANGKLTALPNPTRDGYTFNGWYTAADGGESVTIDKVYAADTTLYAHWTEIPAPEHTHNWATDWSTNLTHHWYECSADNCTITNDRSKKDYGEHVYDNDTDTTCNTCGHTRTVTPSVPEHTHNWATAWSSSTTHHWHECSAGNCTITNNSGKNGYGAHIYDDDTDTTCNTCDYIRTLTPSDTHYISIPTVSNGSVISSTRYAEEGERVTLTAHPDKGYKLDSITVTDIRGRGLTLRSLGNNGYSFIMPGTQVSVSAVFTKVEDATSAPAANDEIFTGLGTPGVSGIVLNPAPMPFTDVSSGDWFYNNVEYVWKHYLMSGVSDTQFAPGGTTTRAMIWTILARMNNVRTDINPGSTWYEKGQLWAQEQGVTDGTDPMADITREQLATMLWRNAGSPGGTGDLSRFGDSASVSAYALTAIRWAVGNGILNGSNGNLDPQGTATRAQVAAMVMRYGERIGA